VLNCGLRQLQVVKSLKLLRKPAKWHRNKECHGIGLNVFSCLLTLFPFAVTTQAPLFSALCFIYVVCVIYAASAHIYAGFSSSFLGGGMRFFSSPKRPDRLRGPCSLLFGWLSWDVKVVGPWSWLLAHLMPRLIIGAVPICLHGPHSDTLSVIFLCGVSYSLRLLRHHKCRNLWYVLYIVKTTLTILVHYNQPVPIFGQQLRAANFEY